MAAALLAHRVKSRDCLLYDFRQVVHVAFCIRLEREKCFVSCSYVCVIPGATHHSTQYNSTQGSVLMPTFPFQFRDRL